MRSGGDGGHFRDRQGVICKAEVTELCGRFSLAISPEKLAELFKTINFLDFPQRFNIAPTQPVVGIRAAENHDRFGEMFRWGLVPFWAKDLKIGQRLTNARAETLKEKPSFRGAYKYRRCLIPSSGFYEWKTIDRQKQPFYIRLRDRSPMAMAGLYEIWTHPEGSEIRTATIITTRANDMMAPLHHRMPVLLDSGDYDRWLDPSNQTSKGLDPLLKPYPSEKMEAYRVSAYVSRTGQEGPRCIAPVELEGDAPAGKPAQGELF